MSTLTLFKIILRRPQRDFLSLNAMKINLKSPLIQGIQTCPLMKNKENTFITRMARDRPFK